MGVVAHETADFPLVGRPAVDWSRAEDGQGEADGPGVAPCDRQPHPPSGSRPNPVGTRWHAARAGPDTFDKRRRNGKQRAAGDLEKDLSSWPRDTLRLGSRAGDIRT
ncbi:hypothetical protein KM043_006579 [Ampulex compressa]|nr:hypothetical protein KM043_006579 [Ampulex compressa]